MPPEQCVCGRSFETSLLQKCQKLNNSQLSMSVLTHKQGFVDAPGIHLEINCLHCSGTSFLHRLRSLLNTSELATERICDKKVNKIKVVKVFIVVSNKLASFRVA